MKRSMVTTTSDGLREEIDFSLLSDAEINRRISTYEQKYGSSFPEHLNRFSCDDAGHDEVFDLMDWETLVEEREERRATRRMRP